MALFFKRHAWGNATLEQFLSALESAAGTSLTAWAASWLQTTGVNSLAATYTLTHENKYGPSSIQHPSPELIPSGSIPSP